MSHARWPFQDKNGPHRHVGLASVGGFGTDPVAVVALTQAGNQEPSVVSVSGAQDRRDPSDCIGHPNWTVLGSM